MRARILNLTDTKNVLVRSYKPQSDGVIKFFCVLDGLCSPGGHSIVIVGWFDTLGSGILVGKRYFGALQKY